MISSVSRHITLNLVLPELLTRRRLFEQAAVVPMPEASLHKYDGTMFGKDKVGLTRQSFDMQPEPETKSMESATH